MALVRRRSSVQALANESSPLLKFDDEKAFLHPDGLELIRKIKGPVYPIILMGDGRAGKSYLASRFLNIEEVFVTSDSAEPVTEGIDVVSCPFHQLLQGFGDDAPSPDSGKEAPGTVLVLDCEGGNNAMAAIRTLVNVFGIIIGTEVVFVAGGSFSEAAIQNLGASLAARSLIKLGEGGKLQAPKLVFVVNKNTLKYKEDTLEKSLNSDQKDQGRKDNRNIILDTFTDRKFHAIPLMGFPDFEASVSALKTTVIKDARALVLSDIEVNGTQLCTLLEMMVEQMQTMNEVSLPSMSRYVIFDGFLKPLADRISAAAAAKIPETTEDYDPDLDSKDPREEARQEFEKESSHIGEKGLVEEALNSITDMLDAKWEKAKQINEAIGNQTKETRTETKEIMGAKKKIPVGGRGLLARVQLQQQSVRIQTRAVVITKKGEERMEDWQDSGSMAQRIVESAFQDKSAQPVVFGKLQKLSPSVFQTIFNFGGKWQERSCIVKEGHFIWWDSDYIKTPENPVSGCINFLINAATVEKDPSNEFQFSLKPKGGQWPDPSSFSGGANREMTFSSAGSDKSRDEWVDAIQRNIDFGALAYAQIGEKRVKQEVTNNIPKLAQALWGAR